MSRPARYISASVVTGLAAAGAWWGVIGQWAAVALVGISLVALGAVEVDVVKIKDWLTINLGDDS